MKRITLRVPDHQHAALSRLLTLERVDRGNRYSLNDLCTRLLMVQLSHGGASLPRTGEPAPLGDGTMHIPRMPPPPPVPMPMPTIRAIPTWQPREEPQPERSARPYAGVAELVNAPPLPAPSMETVLTREEGDVESAQVSVPDVGSSPTLGTDIDVERAESEGMPDGHLDH